MKRSLSRSMHTEAKNTNIPHNNREEKEVKKEKNNHIDRDRIKDNVYIKQVPIEKMYEEVFGDAQEKYNKNQKRSDRKIDNYYEKVKNSKTTHEQREMIIQVGSLEDIESGLLDPEEAKEILLEWYEGFPERNPNLEVYNAVIHMDEATPHLHLNFIPVGRDYERGMEKQVAFNRALSQQDESFNKTRPFDDWRDSEIEELDSILAERDIEPKVVGANYKSMSNDRFKEVKDREKAVEEIEKKQERVTNSQNTRENSLDEREMFLNKNALKLNKTVKDVNRRTREQRETEKKQAKKDKELDKKETSLNQKENHLNDFSESLEMIEKDLSSKSEKLKEKEVKIDEKANILTDNLNKMIENAHIPEVRERLEEMKEKAPLEVKEFERLILTDEDMEDLKVDSNIKL